MPSSRLNGEAWGFCTEVSERRAGRGWRCHGQRVSRTPLPAHLRGRAFSVAEAREAGLDRGRLRGRDLHRPFRGVRTDVAPDGVLARAHALTQRLPAEAFFCSTTAALLTGVPLPIHLAGEQHLHVAVPGPRRALRVAGAIGHSLYVPPAQVVESDGLRLSGPELLWLELGAVLPLGDLVAAGDHLVHWRHPVTSPPRLRLALAQTLQRRGRPLLREALPLLDAHAESPQESILRVLLVTSGITGLVSNHGVVTRDGSRYRIDLALPELRIAIEYQGDHHRERQQFRADMTRRSRLEADGWTVIEVNADDLRDPSELLARIRRLLAHPRR